MNCKNIQELLPLYVSRDLEENRARLVTAHVQSCGECSGLVDEYRETAQLLQEFTSPAFSDAVYAGIRQRVMREIESEAPAGRLSTLTGLFASAFQPRMGWAVASAVLLAVGLFAVFFIANRGSGDRAQVEVAPQKHDPMVSSSPLASPSEKDSAPGKTTSAPKPDPHVKRRLLPSEERPSRLASNQRSEPQLRNEAAETARSSNKLNEPGVVQNPEKVLRLEMQTRDPNVRIIWLTPPRNTNDLPNKVFRGV